MTVGFAEWTQNRSVETLGTNSGSDALPFQSWKNFKEAFAPELIARAINSSTIPVQHCFDPFGGSGTTALACQFLGVSPVTVEVNPFLSDLIEAKLDDYDCNKLAEDIGRIARFCSTDHKLLETGYFDYLPPTFIEPGKNRRWLFDANCAETMATILVGISSLSSKSNRRLFKVLLGGMLIEISNARVSGKGRRYRRNWQSNTTSRREIELRFFERARSAIGEINRFSARSNKSYNLIRGDTRIVPLGDEHWDLTVFSPPYPNSFDYTDVYNIELWVLGYLRDFDENRVLRKATLASHVQVSRDFEAKPDGSATLDRCISELVEKSEMLWDKRIPDMVGAYFNDMMLVLTRVKRGLVRGGQCWMVVGDSKYSGVHVPTATILAELATSYGWSVDRIEPFRSMRVSAQQGGSRELHETLVVLN